MSRILEYVQDHYRSIVFTLVLINTGLIFFLIVVIWTGALDRDRHTTRNLASPVPAVETQTPTADSTDGAH